MSFGWISIGPGIQMVIIKQVILVIAVVLRIATNSPKANGFQHF